MADPAHVKVLQQGVNAWNAWRAKELSIIPDLSKADLSKADLREANLSRANLSRADLSRADLITANLHEADLRGASLRGASLGEADLMRAGVIKADLSGAHLSGAHLAMAHFGEADLRGACLRGARLFQTNLSRANLSTADLGWADLSYANLSEADLTLANLVEADLTDADLIGCRIYGVSAWNTKLDRAKQQDLVITKPPELTQHPEPKVTVDNIEFAQFIYLLLHNQKIRDVIDTITSKVVLILGRFTPERKAVLDALREELRSRNYLPVLFDFDRPASRDITETISLLARMARFVVADITEARSIPQELMVIAPNLPSVPIQPLLQKGSEEYAMFEHFRPYCWVLEEHIYTSSVDLIADLSDRVIAPAEAKVRELRGVLDRR